MAPRALILLGLGLGLGGCYPAEPEEILGGVYEPDTSDVSGSADSGDTADAEPASLFFSYEEYPALRDPGGAGVQQDGVWQILAWRLETGIGGVLGQCPYQGCATNADESEHTCPCCGSTFALTGEVTKGPASEALARRAAWESLDGIYVSTEE